MANQKKLEQKRKEALRKETVATVTAGAVVLPAAALIGGAAALAGSFIGNEIASDFPPTYDQTPKDAAVAQVAQLPDSENFSHEANQTKIAKKINEIIEKRNAEKIAKESEIIKNGAIVGGGVGATGFIAAGAAVIADARRKAKAEIDKKYPTNSRSL